MLSKGYLDRIVLLCGVDVMWMKLGCYCDAEGFYWDVMGMLLGCYWDVIGML